MPAMSDDQRRGAAREREAPRELYFSDAYFSMPQLSSFAHQLHHIWGLHPRNVLEIGPGNGLLSACLRRAGIPVTTVDINQALEPDICAPLDELHAHIGEKFDLVVCCEVLEHMAFSEFDANLDHLRRAGDRLFMTLPNGRRTMGIGGIAKIPKLGSRIFDLNIVTPVLTVIEGGPHFWEVDRAPECSRKSIVRRLSRRYGTVRSGRFALNPYHIYFECT